MKVAVLSDIHDNIWNLEKVLPELKEADVLIFCGDFCAPFTLQMMAAGFPKDIHCVLGNNDGDALLLSRVAQEAGNVTLYPVLGEITLGGRRIAFTHYPEVGAALAASGEYDAVFNGHTHLRQKEMHGRTLWVNPGEVMGRFGQPSYGFYDTESGEFTFREV